MTNERLGLGFVGLSARRGWAALAHLPALKSLPDFEVRGLVASSRESAQRAAEHHHVPLHFDTVAQMAARPEIDLIVVTVKTPDHFAAVDAALRAGKPVYCEWPLGNGLLEAEQHRALAKSKGLANFVGLQARAAPVFRYVRQLVADGYVGEIVSSRMHGSVAQFGASVHPDTLYLLDRRNGASLLTIPFGHAVDAMCWCLGEFTELSATLANRWPRSRRSDTGEWVDKAIDDQVAVTGILQGGALASIHFQGGSSRGTEFRWEISGRRGDLVVTAGVGVPEMTELRLHARRDAETAWRELTVPDDYIPAAGSPADPFYALRQAYALVNRDMRDGTQHLAGFDDAVVRHRMIEAIESAAQTGRRQSYLFT
jgi:predicted dehydrogenase